MGAMLSRFSDITYASLWAAAFVLLTALAFAIDFNWLHCTFPGYKILAWPGIVTLRFFSEEMAFWPKIAILLMGQYVTYFLTIFIFKKTLNVFNQEINE